MNSTKINKSATIVANGTFPTHSVPLNTLKQSKLIIACDGAANTLIKKKYTPDIILGDLDSISQENKIKYSDNLVEQVNQSQNDLRKAIDYAKENSIIDISIIGASGKREDHMIGNIFCLLDYKDLNINLFTDTGIFSCVHSNQKIESFTGQNVSIFAADSTIKITSNNLKYNFNMNNISTLYYGTLNESLSDFFEITISHGSLLIFQTYN